MPKYMNTTTTIPVITIDGPSGVGKGAVSLRVAHHLGWHTLDSGALYRVLAIASTQRAIAANQETALANLASQMEVQLIAAPDFSDTRVILANSEVTAELRTETCGKLASQLATLPAVRQALLERQRAFRKPPGLVAEGRDLGTVVFPTAPVKIFLTASVEARAQRRYHQLQQKGIAVTLEHLLDEITQRDQRDRTRQVAPLIATSDMVVIDTTGLSIEKVVALILNNWSQKHVLAPN